MKQDSEPDNLDKPVAYDSQGRPLYAAPPKQDHQVVHFTRAIDPIKPTISPEVMEKHKESMRRYPMLNLSDGEYIISAVHRHPIGMFGAVFVTLFILTAVASFLANYESIAQATGLVDVLPLGAALFGGILIMVLALIGGYIAMWVYMSNQFFLTNESVVQEIQVSLFSRLEQTVSLSNIEDASFTQRGVIQSMLNYGSIRLSTEGDETTYRFDYVRNPKGAIATLNNAVEAFKNGRPVED